MSKGWFGFDLDGTLAHYTGWRKDGSIGDPIPAMVEKVKSHLRQGHNVKILTARVNPVGHSPEVIAQQHEFIAAWTLKHIGVELEATYSKDLSMIVLYDDRAQGVFENTGQTHLERIRELEDELRHVRMLLAISS